MKVKALVSFSGTVTMSVGEIKDINQKEIVKDLLNAGYVKKIGKNEDTEEEELEDKSDEVDSDES